MKQSHNMQYENRRIFKIAAVAAFIFGALVAIVEGLLFSQNDLASDITLYTIILAPMVFLVSVLGYQGHYFKAHPFYLLGLNAAIYAIIFGIVVYLLIIVFLEIMKHWRKNK
jgi:hypothetical protein